MRMLSRRCLLLGALIAPLAAHAQNWPAGNIKIVVPYPPGGSTDMIARLIQPDMQQRLGTTVIIENRSGGGGSIGTAAVAKSSPDGSTWAMVFDNHAANPFVFPNLPFNTEKDLDPVQLIGTAPYVCAVDESSKAIQDTGRCGHRGNGQTYTDEHIGEYDGGAALDGHDARRRFASMPLYGQWSGSPRRFNALSCFNVRLAAPRSIFAYRLRRLAPSTCARHAPNA